MADSIRETRVDPAIADDVDAATEARRRADLNRRDLDDQRASADDVSPHYGGRAQPGDILGIETGGETTSIGDTSDDENKRRNDAEKNAPKPE